jgi:hypothetical protein
MVVCILPWSYFYQLGELSRTSIAGTKTLGQHKKQSKPEYRGLRAW